MPFDSEDAAECVRRKRVCVPDFNAFHKRLLFGSEQLRPIYQQRVRMFVYEASNI